MVLESWNAHVKEEKVKPAYTSMHVVNTHFYVLLRTSTEFIRQYWRISTEAGQTHTQGKTSERMASLISSMLARISRKLDRVEQKRYTLAFSRQNQLQYQLGKYSMAPGGCFVLVFRMWLILSKTRKYKQRETTFVPTAPVGGLSITGSHSK